LNGWESGREDIEKHENRFADMNTLGERIERDNLEKSGQLVQGAGRTTPPGGRRGMGRQTG
jgi:hypothetical protein